MPIYEYECLKCHKSFEHLLKNRDDEPGACPACGGRRLRRALSAFSVGAARQPAGPKAACADCPSGSCPYSR